MKNGKPFRFRPPSLLPKKLPAHHNGLRGTEDNTDFPSQLSAYHGNSDAYRNAKN
jgi:hypothetical protein